MLKSPGVIHSTLKIPCTGLFSLALMLWLFMTIFSNECCSQSVNQSKSAIQFSGIDPLWNTQNLSGNFGEPRGNHFHSGIDYKTRELEGLPVLAVDDGYVSRIKISSGGYGKAIYLTHPGGVVTVYGHLRKFFHTLEDTIRKIQESKQQYEIEIFPDPKLFPVTKGELIGFSGNTGSSSGPHLHFETRHTGSELPFNPVIAGYRLNDTIPPIISSLIIYEPGPLGGLTGSSKHILEQGTGSKTRISDTISVAGPYFVGVEAFDLAGNDPNHIGINSGRLYVDDSLAFTFAIDSFSFSQTRTVQVFLDYEFYSETGREVTLFYVMAGNKLPFYRNSKGLIEIKTNNVFRLRLEIKDASGNTSEARCFIRKIQNTREVKLSEKEHFTFGEPKKIKLKHCTIDIPPAAFYESVYLNITEQSDPETRKKSFSPVLTLTPDNIPVNESISVSMKCTLKGVRDKSKLVVARNYKHGYQSVIPGTLRKKVMYFNVRNMGSYVIMQDTSPPRAQKPQWEPDNFTGRKKIFIPLENEFSGLKSYSCLINRKWVPAAYNSSRNGLVIYPEDIPQGAIPGQIRIRLEDEVSNTGTYEYSLNPE